MYTHRRQNLLIRRKLHQTTHLKELREEQSLLAGHNRRRRLEDMIASLSNHLQVYFRQSVQYAAWYFETRTWLVVVEPTFATHAVNDSKMSTNPVQHAGKRTLNSILTRVLGAPSTNYMCCAHTVRMAVNGRVSWESWSTTWVKSSTLVSHWRWIAVGGGHFVHSYAHMYIAKGWTVTRRVQLYNLVPRKFQCGNRVW